MIHPPTILQSEPDAMALLAGCRSLAYVLNDLSKEVHMKGATSLPVDRSAILCLATSATMLLHAMPEPEAPRKPTESFAPLAWKRIPFWRRALWIVS